MPDGANAPIPVLLVDDHQLFRDGLRLMLEADGAYRVLGEAGDGRDAVERVRELRPALVIMDVTMPELNGLEATQRIRELFPGTHVIALSARHDEPTVAAMFRAGARAYVIKADAFDELRRALQVVRSGRIYISPGVADDLVARIITSESAGDVRPRVQLSSREREVVQLIAEGLTTKEIAGRLYVGVKTVETYRKQLMDKLGIRSIAGLTKWAIREGLTPAE